MYLGLEPRKLWVMKLEEGTLEGAKKNGRGPSASLTTQTPHPKISATLSDQGSMKPEAHLGLCGQGMS